MVAWKSLRFRMELRAFKLYSLQFFQFYTIICFRDTKQTRFFFKWQQGSILLILDFFSGFNDVSHVIIVYITTLKIFF
jgi:hypothetical protein